MTRILAKLFTLIILFGGLFTPISNAVYSDTETSVGNTFTAGCWSPPSVPVLNTPTDGYMANATSEWTLHPVMDWHNSTFVCPGETVSYQYESYRNDLAHLAYRSAWLTTSQIPAGGTPEGVYLWRVKARDSQGRESGWSDVWQITVDRTAPVTTLSFDGKTINEKIINGGFEGSLSGWEKQGQVVRSGKDAFTSPFSGSGMVRIGHRNTISGNEIWENRLRQQIQPGAKNLSFYYNFFSYDSGRDNPGMVVRLNDYNVFYLSASEIEDLNPSTEPNKSGWKQLSFDISKIPDPVLEIIFYSGNTGDEFDQSWVYIDNVSTAEAVANSDNSFTLSVNEPATIYYSLDGSAPVIHPSNSFNVSEMTDDEVWYYSCDTAGNCGSLENRRIVGDIAAPDAIDDLLAFATSKQSINLTWIAPAETTVYDMRYSLDTITDLNFDSADRLPNPPAPTKAGIPQEYDVTGLDANETYYFAMKAGDAALNWSAISNVASTKTEADIVDPNLNEGDVVINELMWMGTSRSVNDEYIELRNMTDRTIDLAGWQLTRNNSGTEVLMTTILSGAITPHGYFLITDYDQDHSAINVTPDLVIGSPSSNDSGFVLRNTNLQIQLYAGDWLTNSPIDVADNASHSPAAGIFDDSLNRYWSMERDASPGDGTNADVWHTCLDNSDEMHAYWDSAVECGTPGRENLSQRPVSTESTVELNYSNNKAGFIVSNISQFNLLHYVLAYDSDSGDQAIIGNLDLHGENQIEVKDLVLGTCSSGGACVYHEGVTKLNLSMELTGIINRTLTESLEL